MRFPFLAQENDNDCGLACLAMLYCYYFKKKIILAQIRQEVFLTALGINILELKQLALKYNLLLTPYHINFQQLQMLTISKPIVIQVYKADSGFHFLIIYRKKNNKFLVADPSSSGLNWIKITELTKIFSNIVLATDYQNINETIKTKEQQKFYFSPLTIPKYLHYSIIIVINNLFLITTFFVAQVFYKNFINHIMINNDLTLAMLLLISFFLINIAKILLEMVVNCIYQKFTFYFINVLITIFHNKWFASKPILLQNYNNSHYLQLYQDINNISIIFCHNIIEIVVTLITFSVTTIILVKINWLLCIISIINAVLMLLFDFLAMITKKSSIKKELVSKLALQQQIITTTNNFMNAYFRNLTPYLKKILTLKYKNNTNLNWKLGNINIINSFVINTTKNIISFITIYLSLILIFNKKLTFAQLLFITNINIYINNFFHTVGEAIIFWPHFIKSWTRFSNFINTNHEKNNLLVTLLVINNIIIKNAHFVVNNNKQLFNNLNCNFHNSTFLIGKNGIGKTTLLLLIAKHYQLQHGKILINGNVHLTHINAVKWQQQCIYLSSVAVIYVGTVLENILSFAINDHNLQKIQTLNIINILQKIGLTLFYHCSYKGNNLSQGQKQVIVFLSLFFNNWKVILLDEIFSNVSSELKILLINLLKQHFPQTVIIYTSHDNTLLTLFSQVVNLNDISKSKKS